jgi:hypothetical protein
VLTVIVDSFATVLHFLVILVLFIDSWSLSIHVCCCGLLVGGFIEVVPPIIYYFVH